MTTEPEQWRKSSRSSVNTNCVEVSNLGAVRDSKNPAGPAVRGDLPAMVAAIRAGHFDQ